MLGNPTPLAVTKARVFVSELDLFQVTFLLAPFKEQKAGGGGSGRQVCVGGRVGTRDALRSKGGSFGTGRARLPAKAQGLGVGS